MILPGDVESPPLRDFFVRLDAAAAAAFGAVPYVGDSLAEFFTTAVLPYCIPKRDRLLCRLRGAFRSLEGGVHLMILRMMPMPSGREPR